MSPPRSFAVAVALIGLPLAAQESVRDLDRPGEHHKHLTVDTVDTWKLQADADDVIRLDVSSAQFDPVVDFVRLGEGDAVAAVVVPEVDDPGSRSHLLVRLEQVGRYAIRVHGPEQRGGGNYRLYVERLRSRPMPPEGEATGTLDPDGVTHLRFDAKRGDCVGPFGSGIAELIDPSGRGLDGWNGCFDVERDGEHYVRVRGAAGAVFRVGVERARMRPLAEVVERNETLP